MERIGDDCAPLPIGERDPVHWALNELTIQVVEAMLKELGVSKTLELVRPRMRYGGRVMARNFASRFGLDSEGLDAIIFTPFCARCLIWGGKGRLSLFERGAVVEFTACAMSHGPPEICILFSHYAGEGICEEINPDYEIIYTHHLTQGDPSCIGVCKRKDEPGLDASHLGAKQRVVDDMDIDEKERDALSFNIEAHLLNILQESFLDIVSADRVSQLLSPTFKAIGEEAGQRFKAAKKESDSAVALGSILSIWGEMFGQRYEVKEVREGGRELALSGCVYCHSPLTVCELMESFLAGMISTTCLGASLRFVKCTDAASEACRIVLQPKPSKDDNASSPLVALKMRFVKGEISEEDYRRMRLILQEDEPK